MTCLFTWFQTFTESVLPTFIDPSKYKHRCINNYANLCVDVTWSMCVQDPPLVFIDKLDRGAEFNTEHFRKFTRSGGDKFDYLVWPALRLYHNGPLIVKGIAEPIKTAKGATPEIVTKPALMQSYDEPEHMSPDQGNLVTPPRDGRSPGLIRSDNPEDWVDLDMNSVDNNSWDRDLTQTPNKVYKKSQTYLGDDGPSSPYFAPYTGRDRKENTDIPTIRVQNSGTGARGRYGRSQDGQPYDQSAGNLTVMWKQNQAAQDRQTSAP